MKSYDMTIQMKLLQQYFHMHMVLFIKYEALTFDSVDEIEWCYHLNDEIFRVLVHGTFYSLQSYGLTIVLW